MKLSEIVSNIKKHLRIISFNIIIKRDKNGHYNIEVEKENETQ